MADNVASCKSCGGALIIGQTTAKSKNPGRWYMKCPTCPYPNGSFTWTDGVSVDLTGTTIPGPPPQTIPVANTKIPTMPQPVAPPKQAVNWGDKKRKLDAAPSQPNILPATPQSTPAQPNKVVEKLDNMEAKLENCYIIMENMYTTMNNMALTMNNMATENYALSKLIKEWIPLANEAFKVIQIGQHNMEGEYAKLQNWIPVANEALVGVQRAVINTTRQKSQNEMKVDA